MTAPHPTTLLVRAARYVITRGECTATRMRHDLRITQAAAAQVIADLEAWGIVGPARGAGSRVVKYSPKHLATVYELIARVGMAPPDPNPLTKLTMPPLTLKQRETLDLAAQGLTDREMARKLYISEESVGSRMAGTLRALDARSRPHAVALGWWYGFLTGTPNLPIPTFTQDQLRLIELVAEGHANARIAKELTMSVSDVKRGLITTREVVGARNRTHLVHLCCQRGVLTRNPAFKGERGPTVDLVIVDEMFPPEVVVGAT